MNEAVKITGVKREELIGSDFFDYFTQPNMAREVYEEVFSNGFDSLLLLFVTKTEINRCIIQRICL
jgi:hypothetical protein